MNKRIIRDDSEYFKSKDIYNLPPKTESLHPLNLKMIYNDSINPICLTKFQIDKNKNVNILSTYKCKNNVNNYKKNLFIPVIGLDSSDFLKIYSVETIDSLYDFVNQNLNKLTLITINRVINCWIRVNFETLKNYNNYLEKIYWIIIVYNICNLIISSSSFFYNISEISMFRIYELYEKYIQICK